MKEENTWGVTQLSAEKNFIWESSWNPLGKQQIANKTLVKTCFCRCFGSFEKKNKQSIKRTHTFNSDLFKTRNNDVAWFMKGSMHSPLIYDSRSSSHTLFTSPAIQGWNKILKTRKASHRSMRKLQLLLLRRTSKCVVWEERSTSHNRSLIIMHGRTHWRFWRHKCYPLLPNPNFHPLGHPNLTKKDLLWSRKWLISSCHTAFLVFRQPTHDCML